MFHVFANGYDQYSRSPLLRLFCVRELSVARPTKEEVLLSRKTLALTLCAGLSIGSAAFGATIDAFGTSQSVTVTAGPPPGQTNSGGVVAGDAIGGGRGITVNRTSGEGVTQALVNDVSLLGALVINSAVGTNSDTTIIWDGGSNAGLDPAGFGAQDLTEGATKDRIRLQILSADLGFTMRMRVYTTVPGAYHEWNFAPGSGASTQDLLFTGATSVGGASGFNAIRAVELLINTPPAGDIAIDFIETTSTGQTPEPSTLGLAAAGLLMAGWLRRK